MQFRDTCDSATGAAECVIRPAHSAVYLHTRQAPRECSRGSRRRRREDLENFLKGDRTAESSRPATFFACRLQYATLHARLGRGRSRPARSCYLWAARRHLRMPRWRGLGAEEGLKEDAWRRAGAGPAQPEGLSLEPTGRAARTGLVVGCRFSALDRSNAGRLGKTRIHTRSETSETALQTVGHPWDDGSRRSAISSGCRPRTGYRVVAGGPCNE